MPRIRRALISVSDKTGVVAFARELAARGVEIISTGGTSEALRKGGVPLTPVAELTGFPEILDGRVKTLHPRIHAGLLAVGDNPRHMAELERHGILPIDLLAVNLYPFRQTVERPGVTLPDALEQIDIGGPAMLRAAAKNCRHKAVIVDPARYGSILEEMTREEGSVSEATCFALAREVFAHTAGYDAFISRYLEGAGRDADTLPGCLHVRFPKEQDLRYGENPHQRGALYGEFGSVFRKLHGKELSFNNIADIAAAALLARDFQEPAVAIIKHTNPCGVGSGASIAEAFEKALACDPVSAFGGVIACNRPLDAAAARRMNDLFTEVILAPDFEEEALALLGKKKDRRLVRVVRDPASDQGLEMRTVPGGVLVQEPDRTLLRKEDLRVVTRRHPGEEETSALLFGWRVVRHVKSNAIVYARGDRTVGIGAGQMSRVDSARIAARKAADAGLELRGTAAASDAFFPFADGLLEAVRAGSTAVIQPGGSVRDQEVIAAADAHDIAMVFTGIRHFKH
ncbi:MAG: bifunctional phosphoribosylaminoimidazolecarboxamide formyltransferase/IMP cyclohydrolase [Bacteroidota bacterium]